MRYHGLINMAYNLIIVRIFTHDQVLCAPYPVSLRPDPVLQEDHLSRLLLRYSPILFTIFASYPCIYKYTNRPYIYMYYTNNMSVI